jgi:hypothetical protein
VLYDLVYVYVVRDYRKLVKLIADRTVENVKYHFIEQHLARSLYDDTPRRTTMRSADKVCSCARPQHYKVQLMMKFNRLIPIAYRIKATFHCTISPANKVLRLAYRSVGLVRVTRNLKIFPTIQYPSNVNILIQYPIVPHSIAQVPSECLRT